MLPRTLSCWLLVTLFTHTQSFGQTCSNWLGLTSFPSNVFIGDLDVPGQAITVEAMINSSVNTTSQGRDIVSKHEDPTNVNYLLRPDYASITTSTGFYQTPTICPSTIGKTYHVAMTYDGANLKFYRNGFLMSQIAATGDLYQNDFITAIGEYSTDVLNSQFEGYINEVRIWNVVRTQAQLQQYMDIPLPSPTTQTGLLAYYTFDDLTNKQGNAAWNGTLNGSGIAINQTNPNCSFVADSCGILACSAVTDFCFTIDACASLSVNFGAAVSADGTVYNWTISDGATYMNLANPTHTFAQPGTYQVTLVTMPPYGCSASITKSIIVGATPADIIITPDTSICPGMTAHLRTEPVSDFCWSPVTGLDSPQSLTPHASPQATTTYYLNAKTTGANLVVNGDFESGNTGFTSGYTFQPPPNLDTAQYFVGASPASWNPAMSSCTDHTTGTGNMMLVNGSPQLNVNVWTQTITVQPNTNYVFSMWLQSTNSSNPAVLLFSINGVQLGDPLDASHNTCFWQQFSTSWNSGVATTATLAIANENPANGGNDFALDDISFAPFSIGVDSVVITSYPHLLTISPDILVCRGDAVQLYAGGGGAYQWSPAALLDNPASPDPTTVADTSVTFTLLLTDLNQCIEQDSVHLEIKPIPAFVAPPAQNDCTGDSVRLKSDNLPGFVYSWSPATGLNDPSAPDPVASPTSDITYTLLISDSLCLRYDSSFTVAVTVIPSPVVTVGATNIDCSIHTAQLSAAGATTYSWTPTGGLSDPYSPTPVATIDTTTTFTVKGTGDNGCYTLDTVTIKVTATGANTFVVPNAFSPNGDGNNDCFGVTRWGDVQLEEFMIFDRWGARVFDTRSPNDCWDGTFHGKPQPAGAYPYIITAHSFCGEITRKGLVMLVR